MYDLGLELELCEESREVVVSSKCGSKIRLSAAEIIKHKNENATLHVEQGLSDMERDLLERMIDDNNRQSKEIRQKETMLNKYMEEIEALEEKISKLIQELRCRDGQYKELLNENERLERELKWSDGNLTDKMVQLNKHSNLVDDLMKVINILVSRTEGHE